MLDKIKGMIRTKEVCDEIIQKTADNQKQVEVLSHQIEVMRMENEALKESLSSFRAELKGASSEVSSAAKAIKEGQKALDDEVTDFKVTKGRLKEKLVDELSDDFKKILASEAERLKTDVNSYNDLKSKVSQVAESLGTLRSEIDKFSQIAGRIKAADFDLLKHAKKLEENDREKLELMRKIDHLERLISKERRQRS